MQFLVEEQGAAVSAVADRLVAELSGKKRVLWLVSGGSNIEPEVEIMKSVVERTAGNLQSLAILPMDERFGPLGHVDSNTQQLKMAGFDPAYATWADVLMHNVNFEETIDFYGELTAAAIAHADCIVGQFGLGSDGHIAGLLPHSPALTASAATVSGFEWEDYMRMTLTPPVLRRMSVGYVLAYGEGKKSALKRLKAHTDLFEELPANLLYDIQEVYVYNDVIESEG